MSDITEKGTKYISGKLPLPLWEKQLKKEIGELKGELEFSIARRVLKRALKETESKKPRLSIEFEEIIQKLALCTYKDEELPPAKRFAEALSLLDRIGLRNPREAIDLGKIARKTVPETLGLGGAIYKRLWEYNGQIEHLHQSLALYRSAWEFDPEKDQGYGGVNAAYILDILADRARVYAIRSGTKDDEAQRLRRDAQVLREELLTVVVRLGDKDSSLKDQYWYVVTLAEIYFGMMRYEEAGASLEKARHLKAKEWEMETTFRQLVSIARLQGHFPPNEPKARDLWDQPWKALAKFFEEGAERAFSCYRGKVGLALSGGGFRASFYHLGVMARLAEMDVLRSVDVLSTVSGGSIVGAQYYLEVQKLLETKNDSVITKEDYLVIVKCLQRKFLAGVQKNLRTRALSNLWCNMKMIWSKEYSRSHRMGELYEEWLYRSVCDDRETGLRTMPQLLIDPAGEPMAKGYKPKFMSWRRRAKVPVVLINTTSLNSGHSWHFTARWMGEPPGLVEEEIDMNERYRRLWYEQAPKENHKHYRLGYAVAASACVPVLFEPLTLKGLYPGRTVRLVDGGVHDNQGVEGLLNEGCNFVLCSDASGQMADERRPSNSFIGAGWRSFDISADRIREAEYQDLCARLDGRALKGLFFVHLKKDLEALPIDWIDCDNPTEPPQCFPCTTPYGVDRDIQRKLSCIRTDLDSFTEVEAYSLMASGYLMTEYEFKRLDMRHKADGEQGTWGGFDISAGRTTWDFLALEQLLRQPPDSSDARRQDLGRQLETGASKAFKIWQLSPALKYSSAIMGMIFLALMIAIAILSWNSILISNITVGQALLFVIISLVIAVVPVAKWLWPEKAMRGYLRKIAVAVFGSIGSNIHLLIFDRCFLLRGRMERLMRLK